MNGRLEHAADVLLGYTPTGRRSCLLLAQPPQSRSPALEVTYGAHSWREWAPSATLVDARPYVACWSPKGSRISRTPGLWSGVLAFVHPDDAVVRVG